MTGEPVHAFVERALYGPDGFYEQGGRAGRRGASFVTSPEVGPLFGAVLARALDRWWDDAGRPDEWVVIVDADWVDDHNFAFGTALVFSHRKHRREANADLGACREYENVGCFFTGRIRGPIPRFGVP